MSPYALCEFCIITPLLNVHGSPTYNTHVTLLPTHTDTRTRMHTTHAHSQDARTRAHALTGLARTHKDTQDARARTRMRAHPTSRLKAGQPCPRAGLSQGTDLARFALKTGHREPESEDLGCRLQDQTHRQPTLLPAVSLLRLLTHTCVTCQPLLTCSADVTSPECPQSTCSGLSPFSSVSVGLAELNQSPD